jgi:predicted nucleic acid-binding protein
VKREVAGIAVVLKVDASDRGDMARAFNDLSLEQNDEILYRALKPRLVRMAGRLNDRQEAGGRAAARPQWLVPTIVQLELAKWLTREVDEDKADQVIAFTETCVVAELDTATAMAATELCARHKLATADAIVYATALAHGAGMLTCEQHFEGLPDIRFMPKTRG